jgi:ABC-type nitrate/sulfonate/bicarbonate transport system substrate-binding protein
LWNSGQNVAALLNLVVDTPQGRATDPNALYFYDTLLHVRDKLKAIANRPLYQSWTAAEELRLLFDGDAIWIQSDDAKASTSAPAEISGIATLTEDEQLRLSPVVWRNWPAAPDNRVLADIRWIHLASRLGETVPPLANSNLINVRHLLLIKIATVRNPWRLALLFCGDDRSQRKTLGYCRWIFADESGTRSNALVQALSALDFPISNIPPEPAREGPSIQLDRGSLAAELMQAGPARFPQEYAERLEPLHGIIIALYDQFHRLLNEGPGQTKDDHTILFSYRSVNEPSISFLPTPEQAKSFVRNADDLQEFVSFFAFRYPRGKAISGWVLATGMCDYSEQFQIDGRWQEWVSEPSAERTSVQAQWERVGKFFGQKTEQPYLYIVPIVLAPVSTGRRLEPVLMASISCSRPLTVDLRRSLYDAAWNWAKPSESAFSAQASLDEAHRNLARALRVASDAIGGKVDDTNTEGSENKSRLLKFLQTIPDAVKWVGGIAVALGGLFGFWNAYVKPVVTPPPTKIILAQNSIPMAALTIIAKEDGFFTRHNLDVAYPTEEIRSGSEALNRVLSGEAQFATVAETPVVLKSFGEPKPFGVIATIGESSEDTKLVVNSSAVPQLSKLKGSDIAVVLNTNGEYFMDAFLEKNGLKESDIKRHDLTPKEMIDGLEKGLKGVRTGKLDGCFVWQPFVSKAQQLGPRIRVYPGNFYAMTFNIVASKDYVDSNPKIVEEFLLALLDAQNELTERPVEAIGTVARTTGMDKADLESLWKSYDFRVKLDESLVRYLVQQKTWAMQSHHMQGDPDVHQLVLTRPLKKLRPQIVSVQ